MGDVTAWRDGELTVSGREATELLTAPFLADVRVSWVSPGDSARIVKVLDVIEPRTRGPGGRRGVPRLAGRRGGHGSTHVPRVPRSS